MKRRHLLQAGAFAALSPWAQMQALSQTTAGPDYKALVCLFLFGGNDGNNLLVPNDARYAAYQRARPNLALDRSLLLPLTLRNATGLALHPAMAGVQQLVNAGNASVIANIGPLVVPTSLAQWQARSVPLPSSLFSHSDQQAAWQSGVVDAPARSGWGGRLLERSVAEGSSHRGYAAISVAGGNVWQAGDRSLTPYRVSASGRFGFDFYVPDGSDPLSQAVAATLAENRPHPFEQTWLNMMGRSIEVQRTLATALASSSVATPFPDTGLGRQLGTIAKLIAARGALGLSRQCFFASIGGFDTHGDDQLQRQNERFTEISAAVAAFHAAMTSAGLAQNVTLFTASDFGRTLASNGAGTDHGWGSHHLIVGGAAQGTNGGNGGKLLGRMPEIAVDGPDDVGQGVWLPSTATDQVGAELARWFGADAAALAAVWPRAGGFDRLTGWTA